MLSALLIGVSLAMDALCISVATSLSLNSFQSRHALWMGLYFGGFQFLMPLAGCVMAGTVSGYVSAYGPYISFLLLTIIGGSMIHGALKSDGQSGIAKLTNAKLFVMAVATSLDAFAVGVTFAFIDVELIPACAVIGAVTFTLCFAGGRLARFIPMKSGKNAAILGGLVLVGIGIEILVDGIFL